MSTHIAATNRVGLRAHHKVDLDRSTGTLLRNLARDWCALVDSPTAGRRVQTWAGEHPTLNGMEHVDVIVERVDAAGDAETDAILSTLIAIARTGDDLAQRVLLQLMLPGLAGLTVRCRIPEARTEDERWQAVLAAFCTTAPTVRTTRKVAASLILGTLRTLTGKDEWTERVVPVEDVNEISDDVDEDLHEPAGEIDSSSDLIDVLAWAVRTDALNLDEARLLASSYMADRTRDETEQARAAARDESLRKRRSRARAKLIAAVRAHVAGVDTQVVAIA